MSLTPPSDVNPQPSNVYSFPVPSEPQVKPQPHPAPSCAAEGPKEMLTRHVQEMLTHDQVDKTILSALYHAISTNLAEEAFNPPESR